MLEHRPLRHLRWHLQRLAAPLTLAGKLVLRDAKQLAHMRRLVAAPPVVIGGCGRSGTSLLVAALSCHPRLCALENETSTFCRDAYSSDPDPDFPFMFHRLWDRLLMQPVPRGATRLCEKTPKNVTQFQRILDHYGDGVRVLHVVRDGRDVTLSRHPQDTNRRWVPIERWVADVRKGLEVDGDPRVLLVRYEDLVTEYTQTLHTIFEHLEEPWDPALEHFPFTARVASHLAWEGPLGPTTTRSVAKWRRPEHAAHVRELEAYPGALELLERLGYERSHA